MVVMQNKSISLAIVQGLFFLTAVFFTGSGNAAPYDFTTTTTVDNTFFALNDLATTGFTVKAGKTLAWNYSAGKGINGPIIIESGALLRITAGKTLLINTSLLSSGTIIIDGTINNASGGAFDNFGTITNNGTATNNGTWHNQSSSSFYNKGSLVNNGTLNSSDYLENIETITNTGTLNNDGIIYNSNTVSNSGVLNNSSGGTIENDDDVNNSGTLNNSGTWHNGIFSTVLNSGIIGLAIGSIIKSTTIAATHFPVASGGQFDFTGDGSVVPLLVTGDTIALSDGTVTPAQSANGFIVAPNAMVTINDRVVISTGGHVVVSVDAKLTISASKVFVNKGVVSIVAGGSMDNKGVTNNKKGGAIDNSGTINIAQTGVINNRGTINNNNSGIINNSGSMKHKKGGILNNNGSIVGKNRR